MSQNLTIQEKVGVINSILTNNDDTKGSDASKEQKQQHEFYLEWLLFNSSKAIIIFSQIVGGVLEMLVGWVKIITLKL